jgi:ESS family glutamate:Na+ symporter
MFGMQPLTGGNMNSLFWTVSLLGALLFVATVIRVKFRWFKHYYISASLIAGFIGLILGPEVLGVIPKEIISSWGAFSGSLITIVLAPMLITGNLPQLGKLGRITGAQSVWSYLATAMQYAIPCLMSALLFTPVFGVSPLFASVVEQGWAGGHGTAGGMKVVFDSLKYADGASLSITSATVGLIFGVIGGTILINYAARKGYIDTVGHADNSEELLDKAHQTSGCNVTISRDVIDILAFHASLVGIAVAIGYLLMKAFKTYLNFNLYWFIASLLGGLIVQVLILHTKWNKCIDRPTMSRIQGLALEFLVAGAIASMRLTVIVKYAGPLLIQQGSMMILMPALMLYFGRRLFPSHWFENTIIVFGTACGVVATGYLLLRLVDPELKTEAGEAFAASRPFCSPFIAGGILTSLMPGFIATYGNMTVGLVWAAIFFALIVFAKLVGWFSFTPLEQHNN